MIHGGQAGGVRNAGVPPAHVVFPIPARCLRSNEYLRRFVPLGGARSIFWPEAQFCRLLLVGEKIKHQIRPAGEYFMGKIRINDRALFACHFVIRRKLGGWWAYGVH